MHFSLIIPVYNRPDEISELLQSLVASDYKEDFEIVIIEDGSEESCEHVIANFPKLHISYWQKANSGPGDSRNFGMRKAKGDYFIVFDSDCIIPPQYLSEVRLELDKNFTHCFGGPDKALSSFSAIQKAINFAMTSFLTTGGIRGGSEKIEKFQPRSFNMGLSRKAFELSGGFGNIHPGEDPDLSIRLWKLGISTRLFPGAFVYHKRRIDWNKFSLQVNKFGKARPILNRWHPEYVRPAYFLPALFVNGFYIAVALLIFAEDLLLKFYFGYFFLILIVATIQTKSIKIGVFSLIAVCRQFFGYGHGFIESFFKINILRKNPEEAFPELFFKGLPKIIGLTGGIGSGKTTVAAEFREMGIPVYIADEKAKKMLETPLVLSAIRQAFGDGVFSGATIDRPRLAAIVFQDPEKLNELNSIVHPAVKADFKLWVSTNKNHPILIREAAILFESGTDKDCDAIITVTAPLEVRIDRVMKRDNVAREDVLKRIKNQWSDEMRISKSDFVIENVDISQTKLQSKEILKKLHNL